MKHAFQALVWEQVWKNRTVFPVLAVLLLVGAALGQLLAGAAPDTWWVRTAQGALVTTFLASLVLSFAPFTLMESHHGWRMNSMVTRWYMLPVRTSLLVVIPFGAAGLVVGCILAGWMWILRRLAPDFDVLHVLRVLLLGVAAMQTLAWVLPRRPAQFWTFMALGFPVLALMVLLPLDGPAWEPQRRFLRDAIPICLAGLGVAAYVAARLSRRGSWPGEIRLGGVWQWLVGSPLPLPAPRSAVGALLRSDVLPVVRAFLVTWLGFLLVVLLLQTYQLGRSSHTPGWSLALLMQVGAVLVPPLGVLWLAVGGLLLGVEPGFGFRTALSPFRAVRPVGVGTLAAQRVLSGASIWLLVWLPWLALVTVHTRLHPQWAGVDLPEIYTAAGRLMALSAHAMVGALPLLLWGRIDGFPNMLLAGMAAWAATWGLGTVLTPAPDQALPWLSMAACLAAKFALGLTALGVALRQGHITWRFAGGLLGGWLAALSLLVWGLPTWSHASGWGAAMVAVYLPFARLAVAPLAVAANRHR